jgi:heterodisulfide reductase subunit C
VTLPTLSWTDSPDGGRTMTLVDPGFIEELEKLGVDTTMECFNCGTCAAICPLIYEHFPRRMIRYAQLGAKERILAQADELWRCLHCGLCTHTCPRQAKPGELIHGLRRFAIANWRGTIHV